MNTTDHTSEWDTATTPASIIEELDVMLDPEDTDEGIQILQDFIKEHISPGQFRQYLTRVYNLA